jgi:ribosomal protein S8E
METNGCEEEKKKKRRKRDAERKRKQRLAYSEEKKEEIKEKNRQYKRRVISQLTEEQIQCNPKRGNISVEDLHVRRQQAADVLSHIEYNDFTNNTNVTHVASSIQIQESIDRFYKHFGRTLLDVDEDNYIESKSVHQSLVCVVCDCFIIGRN